MSKKTFRILALETSADETGVAVIQGDRQTGRSKILSNIIHSQIFLHRKTLGIVPEVAARAHIPKILPAVQRAMRDARCNLSQIDGLAVTAGPGLITSLMIGVDTAKALAFALNKPIIPVNHLEGHLLSALPAHNLKTRIPSMFWPAAGLIVSGGHTLLVLVKNLGSYRLLGQTVDDAAGEAFDKIAKMLNLPYPGGPAIAKLAARGNPASFSFPRPMLNQKNYDFSFAGLKTAVWYALKKLAKSKIVKQRAHIAAAAEQAIIDVLVQKTLRAAKEYRAKTVLLGGGVAANVKLRQTLKTAVRKNLPQCRLYVPPPLLTTDNASMIGLAGAYHFFYGRVRSYRQVSADPNLPLQSWR